ncbi:hypothetical protein ACM39_17805 [Chryseobacterium sp. FH2]|uniref:T9SS type A sorting domain-containing protein n=1 Tax=Chryseobacterium sp. FH2 TaxID=1674291 RepID=UPI00065AB634|nr:T9SS type A sorting domain-containing protein [Chryseobacterium sp. FH2]KMQ61272.1 hypothetical protein ACM39_17805 [Chryseobacterium sp. FH2]
MKINQFFGVVNFTALFTAALFSAQNYQQLAIQSGYNADVIANGIGSSALSTNIDVDGVSFAFVAKDFQLTPSSTPLTYGVPADGIINTVVTSTPGLSFKLANLSSDNSLRLAANGQSGTLVLVTPTPVTKLYMLSTSGSGTSNVDITVNFTDGTTQTFSNQGLSDWYGGSNYAIQGIGRINRTNDVLEPNTTNPRFYQALLSIDTANQAKPIQSITITKVGTSVGISNIFAFSADIYTDCSAPTLQPVGALTSSSAQVSWTVPAYTQSSGYEIYYSTTNTAPTGSTAAILTNITGTSTTIPNLSPSTTYYYWVRTKCATTTGQSAWSFSGTFKTLCASVVPPYLNDFATVPGNCWANALSGGTPATGPTGTTAYWVSDGFLNSGTSGAMKINLYTTNRTGWLKTNVFDLSAGGYRVKFDYGVTAYNSTGPASSMGSDDRVQFLVSNDGGSTWTILQTWDATTALPSNSANSFSYDLTGYNAANTVFALYATDGTVDDVPDYEFFVDNFVVEPVSLSTSEVMANKKNISVNPNPFKDVLYLSDVKDAKSVVVNDISGRVVKTISNPTKELDLSNLNAGLYLVTVQFKDGSATTLKAIKK